MACLMFTIVNGGGGTQSVSAGLLELLELRRTAAAGSAARASRTDGRDTASGRDYSCTWRLHSVHDSCTEVG